jgi:hypothetical protein
MSPKTTGIVPSTGAVAMVEETSNLAKDHALKAESDHGSDVSAKPGILGELVPPETIPDFLVPMSQDDLAEWEDADEPGIGPA